MIIPILVLIVIAVTVAATITRQTASETRSWPGARAILDRRLAVGELSPDEHARRSAVLAETSTAGSRPRTGAIVLAGVAVVVLVLAAFAWGGTRWSWPHDDPQMVAHMGWSAIGGTAAAPVAGAAESEIVAIDLRFEPATLTIDAGVPVNLALVNDGGVFHDLTIPALGFMLDAEAGERASGSLTVAEPGSYAWRCSVPGHAEAGMRGTLVVRSGSLS